MARLSYVEFPVKDVPAQRDFLARAFGWDFTDFGPEYSATITGDVDVGLNGSTAHAIAAVMPIVEVKEDLEGALDKVVAAGGTVTRPIFAFPGGRRFHFKGPDGNEMGVFITEAEGP
jgi:predicted enzyme related to lactoylglutathione lyase